MMWKLPFKYARAMPYGCKVVKDKGHLWVSQLSYELSWRNWYRSLTR